MDLWWQGHNVAMDSGSYRYTAPDPWNNSLAETFVHNTVEVNGQNQMQRAGRFLWLDWAQATLLNTKGMGADAVAAQHNGYQHLGVIHRRILKQNGPDHWLVIDHLLRVRSLRLDIPRDPVYPFFLQWLLPDWPWQLKGQTLSLTLPEGGSMRLTLSPELSSSPRSKIENISLVRAGKALAGPQQVSPVLGWFSPTYTVKVPALSFSLTVRSALPCMLTSEWIFEPSPTSTKVV